MMRGFVVVERMWPNACPASTSLIGFPKFAVFVKLKNSVRNLRALQSRIGNDFSSAMSMFLCCGSVAKRGASLLVDNLYLGRLDAAASVVSAMVPAMAPVPGVCAGDKIGND